MTKTSQAIHSRLPFVFACFALSCGASVGTGTGVHRANTTINTSSNQVGRVTSTGNSDFRSAFQYDALGRAIAVEYDFDGTPPAVYHTTYGYPQGAVGGPGTVVVARQFPDGE